MSRIMKYTGGKAEVVYQNFDGGVQEMGSGADKDWNELERWQSGALDKQVGGSHYATMAIQPIEFITANNLGFIEGNVIKYICRHQNKNGAEDIKKVIHYCELLLQTKYGESK